MVAFMKKWSDSTLFLQKWPVGRYSRKLCLLGLRVPILLRIGVGRELYTRNQLFKNCTLSILLSVITAKKLFRSYIENMAPYDVTLVKKKGHIIIDSKCFCWWGSNLHSFKNNILMNFQITFLVCSKQGLALAALWYIKKILLISL